MLYLAMLKQAKDAEEIKAIEDLWNWIYYFKYIKGGKNKCII
jgi:hypothetical protein